MAEVPRAGDSASSLDNPDQQNREESIPSFPYLDHEGLPWTSELPEEGYIEVLNDDEAAEERRIYEYRQQHSTMRLPESRGLPEMSFRTGSGLQSLLYGNVVIYECGMHLTYISCDDIAVLFLHTAGSSGQRP